MYFVQLQEIEKRLDAAEQRIVKLEEGNHPTPLETKHKIRTPSPATIAECGGPCEQGFHLCDCGLLEKLNIELLGYDPDEDDEGISSPAPADGLMERLMTQGYGKTHARAAVLACAEWLETSSPSVNYGQVSARWLREEVER